MKKVKIITRKWMGNDEFSWAIFRSDQPLPTYSGLTKSEINYYKGLTQKQIDREIEKANNISD